AQDRTEREIVDLIVRDGPAAQAIRAEAEVTRREQLMRLAYPNPGVLYSREGAGFTEFLQVEQSFPSFGVRAALSRAGVRATAAAEAERDARLWMLRADAAAVVARLIAAEARVAAGQAHAREAERLFEILRTREREGEGSRFDRVRAEQELRDVRQALAAAVVDVAEARAALGAMLPRGVHVTAVASAPDLRSPPPIDALATRAAETRAELRALREAAARADLESDAARLARRPSPTFFGGLKRADTSRRETGGLFGVSMAVPLFDGGGREAARWTAERARVDAEREAMGQRIQSEISGASETLAVRQAALAQDADGGGDELVTIAEVAYREGEIGILELIDAFRTASRARLRTIELRLGARLAQIALERAVGDVLWP
ncbi:MAG TPA: TolC family protein, partial [Candidatus Limnocylindria bacterium]|nr:TolC family protein [Candidatus Limnocylindria bacterium]